MDILSKIKGAVSSFFGSLEVGLDLGTSNTRMAIKDKGVVLRQPTYLAINKKTKQFLFFGSEAKKIYGKTPGFIEVQRPIENGTISDFDATVAFLTHFTKKSVHPFFLNKKLHSKLIAYTTVPASSTEVEQRAIQESFLKADFDKSFILEKPLATAVGAKLNIFSNQPVFIVDMGGGLVEMAVIVMGGIVAHKTTKMAGDYMDKSIYNYLHLKYGLIIGEQTAENLKLNLFTLKDENKVLTIRGKSLENGLPKSVRVKSTDIREALATNLNHLIDMIKELMETIPPEIIAGVVKNGLVLSGGLANIAGIDKFIINDIKIPVRKADQPDDVTINGVLRLIENKQWLDRVLID